ncbi:RNA methyltransferase, TrmH family [Cordyceps fumosorosea ARSEF 2679]|uniref:rRNA methyltransferase 1, mitochondrial n=1 Tax=Cordyceps fumosorosea (strain ARSEF 2679) TaxID=1081104 RepID=A0A167JT47_CORFA|nr:RNA methyltransferase, TrmH family [Cordyceps fumosorosea ARSEF 2679]OAA50716.1 RNA methyltransferase, TrmH family [Cordyceps fumosorosea ARSEF 2679]
MRANRRDDSSRGDRTARAIAGAASPRQQAKLRKKLTRKERERQKEQEEDSGRQTRRKRFLNPDKEFGKTSLVYQLKHGVFKNEVSLDSLPPPVRARPRDDFESERPIRRNDSRDTNGQTQPGWSRQSPGQAQTRDIDRSASRGGQERRGSTGNQPRDSRPQQRSSGGFREKRPDADRHSPEYSSAARKMMPMSIKYTTAASQFLYGRSVVKAALEQSRRKLYNLYVYGGENRVDSHYNQSMIRLAESQGIPVTIVPNDQQRLMDKMSTGRPHNGFVLETSPLPQIPVTSLGQLEKSSSPANRGPGFHVVPGYQTREEEAVNGTDAFIRRPGGDRTPNPLVLLLHEILDPGNLGALLRTASYLGVDAVGVTQRGSSALTPVVLKSAAGAVEEMTLFSVDAPAEFLERSRSAGWVAYAAVAPPEERLARIHGGKFVSTDDVERRSPLLDKPCILVLGNEGHGLPRQVKVAADYELSIPRVVPDSCIDSLNVSVAGALLTHALIKGALPKKEASPVDDMTAARREAKDDESEVLF